MEAVSTYQPHEGDLIEFVGQTGAAVASGLILPYHNTNHAARLLNVNSSVTAVDVPHWHVAVKPHSGELSELDLWWPARFTVDPRMITTHISELDKKRFERAVKESAEGRFVGISPDHALRAIANIRERTEKVILIANMGAVSLHNLMGG